MIQNEHNPMTICKIRKCCRKSAHFFLLICLLFIFTYFDQILHDRSNGKLLLEDYRQVSCRRHPDEGMSLPLAYNTKLRQLLRNALLQPIRQ